MSADENTTEPDTTPQPPLLRVVRGEPDDVELAALTAVVAGLAAGDSGEEPAPRRSRWADRAALVRRPLTPGPGAWRAQAFRR
ncbi:acetyl-CoA carboxylase biotin carboxyl carrier protein subunit [Saccharomonospora sp. CUA-673]|uniref:acyl-CoA carboxylase subunit epsilon n=1 Tax=Saccharomonospora sp. CUA-673 TaxID=1904969 RepID=UPI0009620957|nr:acyl-CoA carboxylase subunit epsilon [Saccharomonospora sp. CUA-673]OLT39763.1 acetyl-CoA carboxylase biotin carboxyl carrier protein subunit [Saccharomonospora sp. CUA-673]